MATDFDVEGPTDDEAPDNELTVYFSDEVAHDRKDLIERAVLAISGFPGVSGAYQQDRELIIVTGDGLDPRDVESRLVAWWAAQG